MNIEGKQLPNVPVYEGPNKKVNIQQLFQNRKGIILGLEGAFTPTCSNSHIPSFIKCYDQLRQKGYDQIVGVTVNDPYVTEAWEEDRECGEKCKIYSDPNAEFTKALNMEQEMPELGGIRSKRYTLVVENGVIKRAFFDEEGAQNTLAENVLQNL